MTTTPEPAPYVITIGRQFGSGGREIGLALAQSLGIDYYDKELLIESARMAGVTPDIFESKDERFPSLLGGIFSFSMGYNPLTYYTGASAISDDGVYRALSDFLLKTASEKSFVVVGRTADYILRQHPRCVNIFIHAPAHACAERIISRGDTPDTAAAIALAEKTNRLRAEYYNFFTDKTWGQAPSYHLSIDSSTLTTAQTVALITQYLRLKGIINT